MRNAAPVLRDKADLGFFNRDGSGDRVKLTVKRLTVISRLLLIASIMLFGLWFAMWPRSWLPSCQYLLSTSVAGEKSLLFDGYSLVFVHSSGSVLVVPRDMEAVEQRVVAERDFIVARWTRYQTIVAGRSGTFGAIETTEIPLGPATLGGAVIVLVLAIMTKRHAGHCGPKPKDGYAVCPNCGYDLRASREKCPECGTPCEQREIPIANKGMEG